jgi:hypothetical protein
MRAPLLLRRNYSVGEYSCEVPPSTFAENGGAKQNKFPLLRISLCGFQESLGLLNELRESLIRWVKACPFLPYPNGRGEFL